jgi:hypothetical protein
VALALVLAVLPLLRSELPGFLDLPNNIARAAIAAQLDQGGFYAQLYRANPPFIPNAAFDACYATLAGVLSPLAIGRVFATFAVLVTVSGVIALARALRGPVALAALLGALLAHDYSLVWGFLNYQLGVGLLLWGVVLWLAVRRHRWRARCLAPAPLALALYYCHIVPLALLGVVIGAIELELARRARLRCAAVLQRLAVAAVPFALPAALFVLGSPTAGELKRVELPDLLANVRGCVKALHAGLGGGEYVHLGGLCALAVLLWLRGRLHLARGLRFPLAALTVIVLIAPDKTEHAACLQQRLPVVLAFLAVGALHWRPLRRRAQHVVFAAVGVTLGIRTVQLAQAYAERDLVLRDAAGAVAAIPEQALVFTLVGPLDRADGWTKYRAPLVHAACLRALHGVVFLPQLLVSRLHHTLAPANETVTAFCQLAALHGDAECAHDVRARAHELRSRSAQAVSARHLPPLPGGVWIVAVHFPAHFEFPSDAVEVVQQTRHLCLLRVR